MFEINYTQNTQVLDDLSCCSVINVKNPQNYIPLYRKFFKLNKDNHNLIQLNNDFTFKKFIKRENYNIFQAEIQCTPDTFDTKDIFIKFSPIVDPTRYMIGKFDCSASLFKLPPFVEEEDTNEKILQENNTSYVDAFFSFLLSKVNHTHNFVNAIDYYGAFLANLPDYRIDIYDDLELLTDSKYFIEHINKTFQLDNFDEALLGGDSRKNKEALVISDDVKLDDIVDLEIKDLENISFNKSSEKSKSISSNSTCSSRASLTESESEDNDDSFDSESDCSSDDDDVVINAYIKDYPVTMIMLERCRETLDSYMLNNEITQDEWASILIQIIIQLFAYQKMFDFTHNDLHTNNVMYIETNKEYVNYYLNEQFYKVPTYGKIWKIIDFGRAIFKFKNDIFCSDSFHPKGDAAGQYNCKPFLNLKKPVLEPNKGFDLSRLGCSLFDYFFEDISEIESRKLTEIEKLVNEWCCDDNNKNVLYKRNGEERYPEFKLYKMIARTVNHTTPEKELKKSLFQQYVVPRKKISKKQVIINIDLLPKYY